jgi:hypothetical protein
MLSGNISIFYDADTLSVCPPKESRRSSLCPPGRCAAGREGGAQVRLCLPLLCLRPSL